jgi:hypothetical protein
MGLFVSRHLIWNLDLKKTLAVFFICYITHKLKSISIIKKGYLVMINLMKIKTAITKETKHG